jgi:hypothetical protein
LETKPTSQAAAPQNVKLIATLPLGALVATSLSVEALGWHRSPGSAKHFSGRSIFLELPHDNGKASMEFLDEGGWRNPATDIAEALEAAMGGKKTKTALSNNALHCISVDAVRRAYLVKTSGRALELKGPSELLRFSNHTCHDALTPDEVAALVGRPAPAQRKPRFYLVLSPLEMLVLSNLSPEEYAWYATHRPGKIVRHLAFAELTGLPKHHLVADSLLAGAMDELITKNKKTKTLTSGGLLNQVPFSYWVGFNGTEGGLYLADRDHLVAWRIDQPVPSQWLRAEG